MQWWGNSHRSLWTPAQITTALWLDAADSATITSASNTVSQWNDKSGNNRHFRQAATGNRPTIEAAAPNGLMAIKFVNQNSPNVRQFLENAFFGYSGNQVTLFSVHRNLPGPSSYPNTYGRLFSFAGSASQDFDNTNGLLLTYGVTNGITLYRNSASVATTAAISNQWCMVDAVRNAGAGSISLDGATRVFGTTSTANQGFQRARIGNDFQLIDSGMFGWISENIVIFGVIDTTTTEKMQGYLAWKWALQGRLSTDHPYKTAPPTV